MGGQITEKHVEIVMIEYTTIENITEICMFSHICEDKCVCVITKKKVPYFNAPIYLKNKTLVGKISEIFGPINASMLTIKLAEGIKAESLTNGDKFFINPTKLLPLECFFPDRTKNQKY